MKESAGVYILGGSQTDFARNWAREGLGVYDMFAECLHEAVADAGIEPGQIQVGHVGNFVGELFNRQGLLGGFFGHVFPELAALPTARHEAACASGSMAVLSAMRDIEAGHYDVACVLGLELMRNVHGKTAAEYLGRRRGRGARPPTAIFPGPSCSIASPGSTTTATASTAITCAPSPGSISRTAAATRWPRPGSGDSRKEPSAAMTT